MSTTSIHDEKHDNTAAQAAVADNTSGPKATKSGDNGQPPQVAGPTRDDGRSSVSPLSYPFNENLFHPAPHEAQASGDIDEAGLVYQEPSTEELLPPPDFQPFFTLIEDRETAEFHHPNVHYIFSDDEPDILTNATLTALESFTDPSSSATQREQSDERIVLLDMAADGKTVVSASSLSPDWQAIETSLTQAPSWGEDAKDGDGKLLLKISGQQIRTPVVGVKKQKPNCGSLEDLVETFGARLDELDQIMGKTPPHETEDESI